MKPFDPLRLEQCFFHATSLPSNEERQNFLDKLAQKAPELSKRLERLLTAHHSSDSFLESTVRDRCPELVASVEACTENMVKPLSEFLATLAIAPDTGEPLLGSYRLKRLVPHDGQAIVFEAHDPIVDRLVAIKIFANLETTTPQEAELALKEARLLAKLRHPNVVSCLGALQQNNVICLIMEWLDGDTLEKHLRGKPLPYSEAESLAIGITKGVAAIHEKNILHRDLKPSNIVLSTEYRQPVIIDFGIAGTAKENQTRTALAGTPDCLAPEIITGEHASPQSDIFSLGCIFYRLFTGRSPFASNTLEGILDAVINLRPSPAKRYCPGMTDELNQLITNMLAKCPEHRPKSAGVILAAFTGSTAETVAGKLTPDRRRLLTAAIGSTVVLSVIAYWATDNQTQPIPGSVEGEQPDETIATSLFHDHENYFVRASDAKIVHEKDVPGSVEDRYWCPKRANAWAEIVYEIQVDDAEAIQKATLDAHVQTWRDGDPSAQGLLEVAGTKGIGNPILQTLLPAEHGIGRIGNDLDVTTLLKLNQGIILTARLLSTRSLEHPEGQHVGYGYAQFMRSNETNEKPGICLRIWRD